MCPSLLLLCPVYPSINWVWHVHKDDGRAWLFAKPFPVLNYNASKKGSRGVCLIRRAWMWLCFRADHHHHPAVYAGCHRRGERGPALSSEPRPISGAQVHLVLQRAAHSFREPWWIFRKSGRRKSVIPQGFSQHVWLSDCKQAVMLWKLYRWVSHLQTAENVQNTVSVTTMSWKLIEGSCCLFSNGATCYPVKLLVMAGVLAFVKP